MIAVVCIIIIIIVNGLSSRLFIRVGFVFFIFDYAHVTVRVVLICRYHFSRTALVSEKFFILHYFLKLSTRNKRCSCPKKSMVMALLLKSETAGILVIFCSWGPSLSCMTSCILEGQNYGSNYHEKGRKNSMFSSQAGHFTLCVNSLEFATGSIVSVFN